MRETVTSDQSAPDKPVKRKVKVFKAVSGRKPAAIYILPNLFTTAGLFAGFYAIMQSRSGQFEAACIALLAAMIMDILDGRIARMTNTTSDFGSEFDSLADMVSFGLTPALVLYEWILHEIGRPGGIAAFLFMACTALRLARFNTQSTEEKRFFYGLPSPAAAAMIGSLVWMGYDNGADGVAVAYFSAFVCLLSAMAMVSNIRYRSFKDFDLKGRMPFVALIGIVLIIALISVDPPIFFFLLALGYLFSGLISHLVGRLRRSDDQSSIDALD